MALRTWVTSSLMRHFPGSPARPAKALTLDVARGERFSFQVGIRRQRTAKGDRPVGIEVEARAPAGWRVRARRVGYVPMLHHNTDTPPKELDGLGQIPGYVPDPLFDESRIDLPAGETHAFWLTVQVPKTARAGTHRVAVTVRPAEGGRPQRHAMTVRVHRAVLQPRRDFRVTNWFYNDALLDWYGCRRFDRRYWDILPAYLRNMADHGQDVVYVPVFTPPLDGVKRPTQLLQVTRTARDRYRFDWRDVKRYIAIARRSGLRYFEWTHLFTQWGAAHAIRIYHGQGADEKRLWSPATAATSPTYRRFLAQYLPALHRFLSAEGLLDRSLFHVSDEPHGDAHLENYRRARAVLADLAPWMKVMDALSDIRFGREKLTDMPVPSIRTALDFVGEGIDCWAYFCCGPRGRYVNRLMDTPLAKIRMIGWLLYRWPFGGFLHWGYNYWYRSQTRELIDPYQVQDGHKWPGWAYGDCFEVYPGPDGPVDSIRWEVFAEGLQDHALLQTLGVDRAARALTPLRSFEDFPRSADWVPTARRRLLAAAD